MSIMTITLVDRDGDVVNVIEADGYQVGGGVIQILEGDDGLIYNISDFSEIQVKKNPEEESEA